MGGGVSAEWRSWILFRTPSTSGVKDPQFHKDIGFYVFRLPFLEFAVGWMFAALLVVLIVTAVFHYLNGGIRLQSPWQRVTPQVKVHLSVILALMALTKTVQYYLARYELVFSRRGFVDGASYTDVHAQLPALNLLMVISIAAAALFIANIFRKGWVFPIIAVGLWAFISLVVGTIYPAVIQRVRRAAERVLARSSRTSNATSRSTRDRVRARQQEGRDPGLRLQHRPRAEADVARATRRRSATSGSGTRRRRRRSSAPSRSASPSTGSSDVDVDRYTVGARTSVADDRGRARARRRRHPRPHLDEPAPRVHARIRRVAAAANLASRRRAVATSSPDIPSRPASSPTITRPARRLLRRGPLAGTPSSTPRCPSSRPRESANHRGDAVRGRRRREDVELRCARAALALRFGDWNLFVSGQLDGELAGALQARRPRTGAHRRAVPEASTPTRIRSSSTSAILWVIDALHDLATATRTRSRSTRATSPTAAASTPTSTTCATR